jgi:glycosyltransferase involved in cell wall biosynthesis
MSSAPIASVLVYTDGSDDRLELTRGSLARQTLSVVEVIVIDVDAGLTGSRPSAERRNEAVRSACAVYVLEIAAGETLAPTTLEKCVWALETRPEAGLAWIGGETPSTMEVGTGDTDVSLGSGGPTIGEVTWGAYAFRRSAWDALGGFDDLAPGAVVDADLILRATVSGWGAVRVSEDLVARGPVTSAPSAESLAWLRAHHAGFFEAAERSLRRRAFWERIVSAGSPVGRLARRVSVKVQEEGLEDSRQWRSHPVRSALLVLPERLKGAWWTLAGLPRRLDRFDEVPQLRALPSAAMLSHCAAPRTKGDHTRVLVIHPYLIRGGAEMVVLNLLTHIDRDRFETDLVTTEAAPAEWRWMDNPWAARFAAQTDRLYHLPAFLEPEYHLCFVLDLIGSRDIDVLLISLSIFGYHALPAIRGAYPDLAVVDVVHAEAPYVPMDHITLASRYRDLLDRRVVTTESVRALQIEKYGETPERVVVIPNGIDTAGDYDPARYAGGEFRRRLGIADGVSIVLFFGRIAMEKQPMHIIEVAERMRGRDDVAFVLIGDGAEKPAVEAEVARRDLVNVVMCPPQQDIAPALADARAVLFPSKREGLPMSGIEAMSMGVPVVASRVPGWTDVVTDGVEGLLVADGDFDGYVAAVTRLVEDETLRAAMSASGRERAVRDYDVRGSVRRWEAVLAQAAEMKAGQT